jgi:hypothetical protein
MYYPSTLGRRAQRYQPIGQKNRAQLRFLVGPPNSSGRSISFTQPEPARRLLYRSFACSAGAGRADL